LTEASRGKRNIKQKVVEISKEDRWERGYGKLDIPPAKTMGGKLILVLSDGLVSLISLGGKF